MVEHSLLNGTVLGAEFDIIFGQHPGTVGRLSAGLPARLAGGVSQGAGRSHICPKSPVAQLIHFTFCGSDSVGNVWVSVTPWTVAHQAPLSMGFSRQEYWSGLPFPSPSFCFSYKSYCLLCLATINSFIYIYNKYIVCHF